MSKPSRGPSLGVITALVVAVAAALSSGLHADSPDAEVSAIKAVLDKQEADWNKGDLDAFLEGYWHSPEVVFQSGGDRHDGFDAMRERYQKRYKAEGKAMGKVAFSKVEIKTLGADSAFVRGAWKLELPDGKKPGGLFTLIVRKFPDGWKIVHDHTSIGDDPAVPPAPPAPSPRKPVDR
ncbi:YybH family protein [Tundrisphaera lichenicola]|uniref:YybH family protein n=1 Tax=Tundrisphaera lichenicola TaxID=2029860 RepID=UPI003EBB617E